jgi:hypothetical protein
MVRPDAHVEPAEVLAHDEIRLSVVVHPGSELTEGSTIECQLPNSFNADQVSHGPTKDWQTEDPEASDHITVDSDGSAAFECQIKSREYVGGYDVPTRHGVVLVAEVVSGSVPASGEVTVTYENTTAPWIANQRPGDTDHEGSVFVRVDGETVTPAPPIRVTARPVEYQRLLVPSSAAPDERVRVLLVSLDKFNNVSSSSFEGVVLRTEDKVLRDEIQYTGRYTDRVALSEEGVYRLTAEIPGREDVTSNPIKVSSDPTGPYWGDIHIHNYPSVDAMGNIPYEYARDVSGLDFAASAEHGAVGLASHWEQVREWAAEWNEPGEFVAIPAFETNMSPSLPEGTHVNVYLYDDIDFPPINRMNAGSSRVSIPELEAFLEDKDALTQLHHTPARFGQADMRRQYHETTELIEIYSRHGTSEAYDPQSSIFMDKNNANEGEAKRGPYYARDAWALGHRFMTHGSSDNHFGQGGVRYNSIAGVYSDALTRESVLDSLAAGRGYATTGERIILEFEVNGNPMGSEVRARPGDQLEFEIEVHGTGDIDTVELFSCPVLEPEREPPFGDLRFEEDDPRVAEARESWQTERATTDIQSLDFDEQWTTEFRGEQTVYYLRVKQTDPIELPCKIHGQDTHQVRDVYAWSSPIWVCRLRE